MIITTTTNIDLRLSPFVKMFLNLRFCNSSLFFFSSFFLHFYLCSFLCLFTCSASHWRCCSASQYRVTNGCVLSNRCSLDALTEGGAASLRRHLGRQTLACWYGRGFRNLSVDTEHSQILCRMTISTLNVGHFEQLLSQFMAKTDKFFFSLLHCAYHSRDVPVFNVWPSATKC
jgi:hypothetical protein